MAKCQNVKMDTNGKIAKCQNDTYGKIGKMSKWPQMVKLQNVKMDTDGKIGKMSKWTQNEIPNLVEVDVQFLLQLSQILLLRLG